MGAARTGNQFVAGAPLQVNPFTSNMNSGGNSGGSFTMGNPSSNNARATGGNDDGLFNARPIIRAKRRY